MKRRLLTFILLLSGMVSAQLPISQLKSFLCSLSNEFQASEVAELNSALSCEDEELFRSYFERIYLSKADEILKNRLSQLKANSTNEVNKGIADIKGDLKDFSDFQLIMKRLNDDSDALADLPKFKNVLKHAELSNKIYWKAERIFFKADYARAKEIFEFLILTENTDSFSKGASYFYLGRMIAESGLYRLWSGNERDIRLNALWQLLQVHKYKTCLTYISFAYADAAMLYQTEGFLKQAHALTMVDVPTMDKRPAECARHRVGADLAFALKDYTNCIRHLQQFEKNSYDGIPDYMNYYVRVILRKSGSNLWSYCMSNPFDDFHKYEIFSTTLQDTNSCPFESEYVTAMAHSWLKREEVPENIATNRMLNNNVFENIYDKRFMTNVCQGGHQK